SKHPVSIGSWAMRIISENSSLAPTVLEETLSPPTETSFIYQSSVIKEKYQGSVSTFNIPVTHEGDAGKDREFLQSPCGNIQVKLFDGNARNCVHNNNVQCQQVPQEKNYIIDHMMDQVEGDISYEDIIDKYSVDDSQSISKDADEIVQISCSPEAQRNDFNFRFTTPNDEDLVFVQDKVNLMKNYVDSNPQQLKISAYNNNNDEIGFDSSKIYYIHSGNLMKIDDDSSCSSIDDGFTDSKDYEPGTKNDCSFSIQILPKAYKDANQERSVGQIFTKFGESLDFDDTNESVLKYSGRVHELLHIGDSSDDEEFYSAELTNSRAESSLCAESAVNEQPKSNPPYEEVTRPSPNVSFDFPGTDSPEIIPDCALDLNESTESCWSRGSSFTGPRPDCVPDSEGTESCWSHGSSFSRSRSPINLINNEDQSSSQLEYSQRQKVTSQFPPMKNYTTGVSVSHRPTRNRVPKTSHRDEELLLSCKDCNKGFLYRKALVKHKNHCQKSNELACKYCNYTTKHLSAMKPHFQQHILHNDQPLDPTRKKNLSAANYFKVLCSSNESKIDYENRLRGSIGTKCVDCDRLSDALDSKTLCQSCFGPLIFTCKSCLQRSATFNSIRLHVIRCHFEKVYRCDLCGHRYSYALDLKRHIDRCLMKGKPFSCSKCDFCTTTERNLIGHMERKHPDPDSILKCEICGACFSKNNGSAMKRHIEGCSGKVSFQCEHCRFVSKSKFSLKRHIHNKHLMLIAGRNLPKQLACRKCGLCFHHFYDRATHEEKCTKV
ncbi:hypothetical protein QAD02_019695, partial [Eretmocerus hayati]